MAHYKEAFSQLDLCLKERMESFHTPALEVALADRDQLVRLSAHGYANQEAKIPLQPGNLFAIGSIGKSFTAIAALQACEAGLIDLHAPLTMYLPWFEVQSPYAPITAHHLLTHSSGLPRGTEFTPDARSEVYALRDQQVGFAPGQHFYYSDLGYKVLGLLLEAVTGRPYADLIREKILEPLEMQDTFAVTSSELRPRTVVGYQPLFDDRPCQSGYPLVPAPWVETDTADGCILSTAEDMAKYARMLLNGSMTPRGPLLSASSYHKLVQPMIEDEGETYSYGLYLFEDEGYHIAGHGGDVPGFESYMWLDLDNGLSAVALMATPYTPRASFLTLEFFRAAYLGKPLPDLPPLPDFTHVPNPAEYAGVYRSSEGSVTFEAANHHLVLLHHDQRIVLEQREFDSFYSNHPDWDRFLLRFERSADGKVQEFVYGPHWYTNERYHGPLHFDTPPEWAAYAGHYRAHNPWESNFRVFTRKGQLILCDPNGEEEILVPLGNCCFRIGEDEYIPEHLTFDQVAGGQALRALRSNCPYYRFFTP